MVRHKNQCTPAATGLPWLVFNSPKGQTFCTISSTGTTFEHNNIPEMENNVVWTCCHGWLLLSTEDDRLWNLWNPTTYDLVHLPPIPLEFLDNMDGASCVFTTSPKSPRCKIMLFDDSSNIMAYCEPGDQDWTRHDYRSDLLEAGVESSSVGPLHHFACLDEVIYAEGVDTQVVAIKFDNQTGLIKLTGFGLEPKRHRITMFTAKLSSSLVESFGEIYSIQRQSRIIMEDISSIEVFRLDFTRKVWVQVEDLDGRVIFLDDIGNYTSCMATETGIRRDQIYYMNREDEHLYVYDLEEGTILKSLPCPMSQYPWYESRWVMPEYPRIDDQVNVKPENKIHVYCEKYIQVKGQTPSDVEASIDGYPDHMRSDILAEIASKLGPLDYLEFRATCRLFQSAAPAIKWSFTSIVESPWLVTIRYSKNSFSFTDPKHNKTYYMKVPESLRGTFIASSKDGFLVLVDDKTVYYFNPLTRMEVKLPTSLVYVDKLNFTSSPSSVGCLAVMMHHIRPKVYCTHHEANGWDRLEVAEVAGAGDYWDFDRIEPGVFHEGMFYFLGEKGNLGVLKYDENGFSWEVLMKPEVPCEFRHAYLMKCNRKLMSVFVGPSGNRVEVFELDPSEMIWERVKDLGSYTLFISNISSIAIATRSPGMENKVYFSRFYDERIVYYSLQTKKFHTHGSNLTLDTFVDTKEQFYSTWIEPRQETN